MGAKTAGCGERPSGPAVLPAFAAAAALVAEGYASMAAEILALRC